MRFDYPRRANANAPACGRGGIKSLLAFVLMDSLYVGLGGGFNGMAIWPCE